MGNIGEPRRQIEFEPLEEPLTTPIEMPEETPEKKAEEVPS